MTAIKDMQMLDMRMHLISSRVSVDTINHLMDGVVIGLMDQLLQA